MHKNIAIISPNQNAYSETFIQAHRNIKGNIFFYYGGAVPSHLENQGFIGPSMSFEIRLLRFFRKRLGIQKLTDAEEAFAKSLQKNKIDIVIAEYGPTGAYIVDVCRYLGIPLTTIFHGYDASKSQILSNLKIKYKHLFAYSQAIVAVSNPIKQTLISLGCPPEKLSVTPCAPNDLFLEIQPTYFEPKSFIAIGRFVNKKAPYYTIFAFQKVVEKHPDAKLYYAGEGELLEACQNIVSHLKLENNIYLLGIITPDEYAEYLTRVGGFIQHSITAADGDTEGTPVAVLEASAAGIPVIATKHAGIPDVIISEETGLLVEEHDVEGMANSIIRIIENPELGKKLGTKGKQRVKENFTMQKHLKTIEKALEIVGR